MSENDDNAGKTLRRPQLKRPFRLNIFPELKRAFQSFERQPFEMIIVLALVLLLLLGLVDFTRFILYLTG